MFNSFFRGFYLNAFIFLSFIFALFPLQKSFSNYLTNKEIQDLVIRGLDKSYNFKWNEAAQIFDQIITKFPDDPRGYHYQSSLSLWYFLSSKDKDEYENFLKYSDLTIEKGDNLIEKEPNNKDLLYIIGANYTYRAIAFSKAEHYLDAAWATKKSESYLNRVVELDSTYYDAYLGLGLYNFASRSNPFCF